MASLRETIVNIRTQIKSQIVQDNVSRGVSIFRFLAATVGNVLLKTSWNLVIRSKSVVRSGNKITS